MSQKLSVSGCCARGIAGMAPHSCGIAAAWTRSSSSGCAAVRLCQRTFLHSWLFLLQGEGKAARKGSAEQPAPSPEDLVAAELERMQVRMYGTACNNHHCTCVCKVVAADRTVQFGRCWSACKRLKRASMLTLALETV